MTEENRKAFLEVVESERRRLQEIPTSRPLPCVRDEHGEIKEQAIKALLAKVDEELNELKEEIYGYLGYCTYTSEITAKKLLEREGCDSLTMAAEEAADTITAITTLCEALGIDAAMRSEAIRRVNEKNRKRGRL